MGRAAPSYLIGSVIRKEIFVYPVACLGADPSDRIEWLNSVP